MGKGFRGFCDGTMNASVDTKPTAVPNNRNLGILNPIVAFADGKTRCNI